jgi:hypothetical protein
MRTSALRELLRAAAFGALVSTASLGCKAKTLPIRAIPHEAGPRPSAFVDDDGFGPSLRAILIDGGTSPEREALVSGVVKKALARSLGRFEAGFATRGTQSVLGALELLRIGEGEASIFDEPATRALEGAVIDLSPRGNEGQVETLMRIRLSAVAPGSPRAIELAEHLGALTEWMKDTSRGDALIGLAAAERVAVARSLVDSSPAALDAAADAVDAWIDRAIEISTEARRTAEPPSRNVAMEAARALETGPTTLASLFLRHGDAKRALDRLGQSNARSIVNPALLDRIRRAAVNDAAFDWQRLAAVYRSQQLEDASDGPGTDPALWQAAQWGTALEAYRRDRTNPLSAMTVARALVQAGLSEAVPSILADALGAAPAPAFVAAGIALVVEAMANEAEVDDLASARRIFAAAAPIFAVGDRPDFAQQVDPSPARARYAMASLEVHGGDLSRAKALLETALATDPTAYGFTLLATIERQLGQDDLALANVRRAASAPDAESGLVDVAEAQFLAFEIHRDARADADATRSLADALRTALDARHRSTSERKTNSAPSQARAERALARALDAYDQSIGAGRALDRAMTAASADRAALSSTVLDAARRALVRGDVALGQAALNRALEASIDEDDLVYASLWVHFLEQQKRSSNDATARQILHGAERRSGWTGKLAAWSTGRLTTTELSAAARSSAQKTEARFYAALARLTAGETGAEAELRDIARCPLIDLLEVRIARELTTPRGRASLPSDIALP